MIAAPAAARKRGSRRFDYSSLPSDVRELVREETQAIWQFVEETACHTREIGRRLKAIRKHLGRESFGDWLDSEFPWTRGTASNCTNVAMVFHGTAPAILARFQPSAAHALARKKTPQGALREALERASAGEIITKNLAQRLIEKHGGPKSRHAARVLIGRALALRGKINELSGKLHPEDRQKVRDILSTAQIELTNADFLKSVNH